jgi:Trypsin-like peptidase domain
MPLVAYETRGDKWVGARALGTTFAIGDGLLLTAKHVFDPIRCDERRAASAMNIDQRFMMRALFVSDEPRPDQAAHAWGGGFPITAINVFDNSDIALLTAQLPVFISDGTKPRMTVMPLTLSPPSVSSNVLALGYLNVSTVGSTSRAGKFTVNVEQRVIASRGTVEEIYPEGRDTVMIRFPAIQTNSPAPHGMSGGPVINTETGCVRAREQCDRSVRERGMDLVRRASASSLCAARRRRR